MLVDLINVSKQVVIKCPLKCHKSVELKIPASILKLIGPMSSKRYLHRIRHRHS